jgi:hypothetical protein
MEHVRWTDERLDDLAASIDLKFELLREDIRDLRGDIGALRNDFSAWQRQIAMMGWTLAVALVGAVAALIVALVA